MEAAWRALGIVLAVVAIAGCGDSDDDSAEPKPVSGSFVGRLTGSDAYVAVVAGKENVVAYACDGAERVGQLFVGRRSGDTFTGRQDGARIDVELSDAAARGQVTLPGAKSAQFSATRAKGGAGFYRKVTRLEGRELRLAWVVLADGSQRGALVREGTTTVAPSLKPSSATFSFAGRTLTAARVSSGGVDDAGLQGFGGQFGS